MPTSTAAAPAVWDRSDGSIHRPFQLADYDITTRAADPDHECASAETYADHFGVLDLQSYIESDFSGFLTHIRKLSDWDQELLLSYYVLGKTQTQLATIYAWEQAQISRAILSAQACLAWHLLHPVPLTADILRPILARVDPHRKGTIDLAAVAAYRVRLGSWEALQAHLGWADDDTYAHRIALRRCMARLKESTHVESFACWAYLRPILAEDDHLYNYCSIIPPEHRLADVYHRDPSDIGDYRINVTTANTFARFSARTTVQDHKQKQQMDY